MDEYNPCRAITFAHTTYVPSVYPQDTKLGSTESHCNSIRVHRFGHQFREGKPNLSS